MEGGSVKSVNHTLKLLQLKTVTFGCVDGHRAIINTRHLTHCALFYWRWT